MRPVWRVLSFFEQWIAEVAHQPALLFTLVVAPFLLLLAFGAGVKLTGPQPRTVIVLPENSAEEVREVVAEIEKYVDFRGYEESLPLARASLERGQIDAVIVVPDRIEPFLETGKQVPLWVLIGEVDPVRRSYARTFLRDQVGELNQQVISETLAEVQAEAPDIAAMTADARRYVDLLEGSRGDLEEARVQVAELRRTLDPLLATLDNATGRVGGFSLLVPGLSGAVRQVNDLRDSLVEMRDTLDRIETRLEQATSGDLVPTEQELAELRQALDEIDAYAVPLTDTPPEVLSAPFELQLEDVTPVEPSFTSFYSPGVLVLLTQHLAITLGALTLSGMRLLRVTDMLRVSPIRAPEVLAGNYLAYGVLCGLAAAGLLALMVFALDIPVFGAWSVVAGTVALIILVSLGIGFVISLISSSTQQATQMSMLVLLGSIFFSGFAFSLDQLIGPARAFSYAFPATYGIRLLQDEMLRGITRTPMDMVILGAGAVLFFLVAALLMRRELQPR